MVAASSRSGVATFGAPTWVHQEGNRKEARETVYAIADILLRNVMAAIWEKYEGALTPRELRHTFVSWMSDHSVRDDLIADLLGHKKTSTTRTVYRHHLRPVITKGAELLDETFGEAG